MKLGSLFALAVQVFAAQMEVWDEFGMVSYFDDESAERGSGAFGKPDNGPRMCGGKKIPSVKHG